MKIVTAKEIVTVISNNILDFATCFVVIYDIIEIILDSVFAIVWQSWYTDTQCAENKSTACKTGQQADLNIFDELVFTPPFPALGVILGCQPI